MPFFFNNAICNSRLAFLLGAELDHCPAYGFDVYEVRTMKRTDASEQKRQVLA